MGPETVSGCAAGTVGEIGNELQHGRTDAGCGQPHQKIRRLGAFLRHLRKSGAAAGAVIYCIDEYEVENGNR